MESCKWPKGKPDATYATSRRCIATTQSIPQIATAAVGRNKPPGPALAGPDGAMRSRLLRTAGRTPSGKI